MFSNYQNRKQQQQICNIREREITVICFTAGYYSKPGPVNRCQFIIDSLNFKRIIDEN